jgi:hypothetical protein
MAGYADKSRTNDDLAVVFYGAIRRAMAQPFLALVEVAMIRDQRLVSFFVRQVVHCTVAV